MHASHLIWDHHERPAPKVAFNHAGTCSGCGAAGDVTMISSVVSLNFTDWDRYPDVSPSWCAPCQWIHQSTDLRVYPWLIGPAGVVRLDGGRLADLLTTPLPADVFVTVPISRHKHLIARAVAGVITTDDAHLSWRARQCDLLAVLARLKEYGFSETALGEPAPRWGVLSRLSSADKATILRLWGELNPWRSNPLMMNIALRATRREPTHV